MIAARWPGARSGTPPLAVGRRGLVGRLIGQDQGSVTVFVAIAAIGLLAMAGLAVDGGAKVRAAQRADRVAAEAGRAALQALDQSSVMGGGPVQVDRRAARAAALHHLAAAGLTGTVEFPAGGATLTVRARTTEPTVFLTILGVREFTVHGQAEVVLVDNTGRSSP